MSSHRNGPRTDLPVLGRIFGDLLRIGPPMAKRKHRDDDGDNEPNKREARLRRVALSALSLDRWADADDATMAKLRLLARAPKEANDTARGATRKGTVKVTDIIWNVELLRDAKAMSESTGLPWPPPRLLETILTKSPRTAANAFWAVTTRGEARIVRGPDVDTWTHEYERPGGSVGIELQDKADAEDELCTAVFKEAYALGGVALQLEWLFYEPGGERPCHWRLALRHGRLGILSWLHRIRPLEKDTPVNERTMREAAKYGQLGSVQWLRAHECPWSIKALSAAAAEGHLRVVAWMRNKGCPWSVHTMIRACSEGRLGVVKWLRNKAVHGEGNVCPWNARCVQRAAAKGHLAIVQWLRDKAVHGEGRVCPWSQHAVAVAAANGHLEIVQWLRAQRPPCDWTSLAIKYAAQMGHANVVQWLWDNEAPQPSFHDLLKSAVSTKGYYSIKHDVEEGQRLATLQVLVRARETQMKELDADWTWRWGPGERDIVKRAAAAGYVDILKYVKAHGFRFHSNRTVMPPVTRDTKAQLRGVVEYLWRQQCPMTKVVRKSIERVYAPETTAWGRPKVVRSALHAGYY